MTEPLRLDFEVDCPVAHAFAVWTGRIDRWWPADHTVSGNPAEVVLEARVGGRIFERTSAGEEHDWGEVTRWEPPHLLGYSWHLRSERDRATDVEIRFSAVGTGTLIEIEHHGWERLGADGEEWRRRNRGGWQTLLPHFRAAAERSE
jgi:uncharacterized protein YndB with AHSA1/START domain